MNAQPTLPRARRAKLAASGAVAVILVGVALSGCGSSNTTPTTPQQLFNAGLSAQKSGNYTKAANYFAEVLVQAPKSAQAAYNLGVAEGSLGNLPSTINAYKQAIALDPKFANAYFNLGDAQAPTDPQAAIATFRHLLKLTPSDPNTQFNLGLLLAQHGKLAEGQKYLKAAITANPSLKARVPASVPLPAGV